MARKNPVPERERDICHRVREVRKLSGLSQTEAALKLGVDRSLLASYEHSRVPIRFQFAYRFCKVFRVSVRWLAEGSGPKHWPLLGFEPSLIEKIPNSKAFTAAYEVVLKPLIKAGEASISSFSGGKLDAAITELYGETFGMPVVGEVTPDQLAAIFAKTLMASAAVIPPHLYQELFRELCRQLREFTASHSNEIKAYDELLFGDSPKEGVDTSSLKSNSSNMKSELERLIARVRSAAAMPGAKKELAHWLQVAPARVSEWLAGKKEPGGNYTLRLLRWVELRERSAK